MSGSGDGIRQWRNREVHPSCAVEKLLLCSFSGLHEDDGKILAKDFYPVLA